MHPASRPLNIEEDMLASRPQAANPTMETARLGPPAIKLVTTSGTARLELVGSYGTGRDMLSAPGRAARRSVLRSANPVEVHFVESPHAPTFVVAAGRPPAMLSREEAAAYVGVGLTIFDAEVEAGLWPPPIRRGHKGAKPTWAVVALDARIAELLNRSEMKPTVEVHGSADTSRPWSNQKMAALERLRRQRD